MERAAKNTSSVDKILNFFSKFYKNIINKTKKQNVYIQPTLEVTPPAINQHIKSLDRIIILLLLYYSSKKMLENGETTLFFSSLRSG